MRFAAGETVSATRSFATSLLAITVVVATLGLAGYAAAMYGILQLRSAENHECQRGTGGVCAHVVRGTD